MTTLSPISATRAAPAVAAATAQSAPAEIDFQNFLRLLTAQLRNQDPLSPTDSTQFVSQLASFSTVEQLVSANAKLDRIGERLSDSDLVSLGGLIGKAAESEAPTPQIDLPVSFRIPFNPAADAADLVVRDRFGVEVARARAQNSEILQNWIGLSAPPAQSGPYYLFGEYFANGDTLQTSPATTISRISSIHNRASGIVVGLEGDIEIALSAVNGFGE